MPLAGVWGVGGLDWGGGIEDEGGGGGGGGMKVDAGGRRCLGIANKLYTGRCIPDGGSGEGWGWGMEDGMGDGDEREEWDGEDERSAFLTSTGGISAMRS